MTEITPTIAESVRQSGAAEAAALFVDTGATATLGATEADAGEAATHDRSDYSPSADPNAARTNQRLADRILRYRDLNDGLELLPPYARSLLKIKVPIIVTLAETKQPVGKILELVPGGADYAFDTTGNAAVVRALYEGLNNLGTLALAGVGFGDVTFPFHSMISGRTIKGVIEGDSVPRTFIPELARLNAEGRFPFHELITKFPLKEINAAEAASASGVAIKPVLIF